MKKILTILLLFLCVLFSNATTITAISNAGQGWTVASNWSPAVVPQNGDTVIIPAGVTMSVKTNIYNSTPNLIIRVSGTLNFSSGGKLDLGTNSKITLYTGGLITTAGTPSETIKIGNVTKYKGNADGTIVGPAYTDNFSGASPSGFSLSILPVQFHSFIVKINSLHQAELKWTVDENNISEYIVEKSNDAIQWKQLSKKSSQANNQGLNTYTETDRFLSSGVIYYRIHAAGNSGESFYSSTEVIKERAAKEFTVYPNPVSSKFRLLIDTTSFSGAGTITLYNSSAVPADRFYFRQLPVNPELNVSHLSKGIYRVVVSDNAGNSQTQTIILY